MPINAPYNTTRGWWRVRTEGDCEGKSVRDLGTYFGELDDIAFGLADKCYYSLTFTRVDRPSISEDVLPHPLCTKRNTVFVTLDIKSGTWDMKPDRRAVEVEKLMAARPVKVKVGQYYASVLLERALEVVRPPGTERHGPMDRLELLMEGL